MRRIEIGRQPAAKEEINQSVIKQIFIGLDYDKHDPREQGQCKTTASTSKIQSPRKRAITIAQ